MDVAPYPCLENNRRAHWAILKRVALAAARRLLES